jgi:hypothetical protein
MKCPYRVAGKASALRTGKRASGGMPIQSCGQSVSARRGKQYTEIGLLMTSLARGGSEHGPAQVDARPGVPVERHGVRRRRRQRNLSKFCKCQISPRRLAVEHTYGARDTKSYFCIAKIHIDSLSVSNISHISTYLERLKHLITQFKESRDAQTHLFCYKDCRTCLLKHLIHPRKAHHHSSPRTTSACSPSPHPLTRLLTRSLTSALTHSRTHSCTLTHARMRSLTMSSHTRVCNHSLTHALTHSSTHSLTRSIMRSLMHARAHSSPEYALTRSLTHSLTHTLTH